MLVFCVFCLSVLGKLTKNLKKTKNKNIKKKQENQKKQEFCNTNETTELQKSILKIGQLLYLVFGQAGNKIIVDYNQKNQYQF